MAKELSNQKKWKVWQGFVYFIVLMVILFGPYSMINEFLGLPGIVIGQLIFLASAIIVTKLHKTPLKEVFPIEKISFVDVIGVLILTAGAILANLAITGMSVSLIPKSSETLADTKDFLYGSQLPAMVIVLIISLTPAICEEAIMRGALLSHFRGIKKDWLICLLVGLAFAIMHTSTVQFASTTFIGVLLAYIVVKRNNILLASIVHFINNFFSSAMGVLSNTSSGTEETEAALNSAGELLINKIGTFMILGFLAPILILLGAKLLKMTKTSGKKWAVAVILSVVLFVGGMVCMSIK